MKHDSNHNSPPGAVPGFRRRARATALFVAVVAVVASGCGGGGTAGPKVATAGSTTTVKGASNQSTKASPIAFSKCMRAHGVTKFPDPDAGGRLTVQAGPGTGLDPNSSVFVAAQKACQSMMPQPTAEERQKAQAQQLKFSKCMRTHGVTDFPDPSSDGSMTIDSRKGSSLDPNSPVFTAAQKACQKEVPGRPEGIGTTGGGPSESGGNAGFGLAVGGK